MATRAAEEERIRAEQGERFLKQLNDMFTQTRLDLGQQFMPRGEAETHFEHLDQVVERVTNAVEKLASNVDAFQQNTPRIYAEKADMKAEMAELRTEIEKLKTARETDLQRGYGGRLEDLQGRYKDNTVIERGWRQHAAEQSNQMLGWVIGVGGILLVAAINVIISLLLRGH